MKKKVCIDCGKKICDISTRCQSCANKLSLNGFKKGESKGHKWKKGERSSPKTEFKNGHTTNIGRPCKEETKKKIAESNTGDKTSRWKGGFHLSRGKTMAKRKSLNFIELNEWFKGSHAHHLNKEFILYIPVDLHRSISHNLWTGEGMEKINNLAIVYAYGISSEDREKEEAEI